MKHAVVKTLWPRKTSLSLQGPGWRIHWALTVDCRYLSIGRHARFHKQFTHTLLSTVQYSSSKGSVKAQMLSSLPFPFSSPPPPYPWGSQTHTTRVQKLPVWQLMRARYRQLKPHIDLLLEAERKKENRHKRRGKGAEREEEKERKEEKREPSVSEWYWPEIQ